MKKLLQSKLDTTQLIYALVGGVVGYGVSTPLIDLLQSVHGGAAQVNLVMGVALHAVFVSLGMIAAVGLSKIRPESAAQTSGSEAGESTV